MSQDTWIALQNVTLTDAHASWFDDVPAELVERARYSAPGRRWMAGQLAARHALFGMPAPGLGEDDGLAGNVWLVQPLADRLDFLQELAATALAPLLRAQVARDQVGWMRTVLGDAAYRRALSKADAQSAMPVSEITAALASETSFRDALLRQAGHELWAFVADMHTLVQQRIRLLLPRTEWPQSSAAGLSADDVAACERRCRAGQENG